MNEPVARISFAVSIGRASTLVGLSWSKYGVHDVTEFKLEEFGKLEATGTEHKDQKFGWAIYEEFFGKVGDVVALKICN